MQHADATYGYFQARGVRTPYRELCTKLEKF